MPLQIISKKIRPNITETFLFDDTIAQCMVGITSFALSFGKDDHHVQTASISLTVNQQDKNLQVTPNATLVDASGHNLDPGNSEIFVAAMAWTVPNDENLKLGNAICITNGASSSGILIPTGTPLILQAALAGFDLSFGSDDHHVQTAATSMGTAHIGTNATITGRAQAYDESGHAAPTATTAGGLIANCDPSLAMYVMPSSSMQGSKRETLTFPAGVRNFVSMLSGFNMRFTGNADHHIKKMGAEFLVQTIDGNKITVRGQATLVDASGNTQDDAVSNVTGFVIGY